MPRHSNQQDPSTLETRHDSGSGNGLIGEETEGELRALHSFVEQIQNAGENCPDDAAPPRFGKYEILKQIARGGQSTTFLARDPDLDRQVVLKLYDKRLGDSERETMMREGRLLAKINSPYVVGCHAIGYSDESQCTTEAFPEAQQLADRHIPFLVLERIDGISLDRLMGLKKFSASETRRLMHQLALGLAAAHSVGLIHRDIKPANIMVGRDGIPKLIDFGLALSPGETSGGAGTGTAAYMSPEQAHGSDDLDQTTDLFGLGAVLYELLTCFAPFRGETRDDTLVAAKSGVVTPLLEMNPNADRSLAKIATDCLQTDRRERPQTAAFLAERLAQTGGSQRWRMGAVACLVFCIVAYIASHLPRSSDAFSADGTSIKEEVVASSQPIEAGAEERHSMTAVHAARPNILICISDDQSYRCAGANGDPVVKTPAFDRVAAEGLRFVHAFSDAPIGGPARAALLTGQPIWRLGEAGNNYGIFPSKFVSYSELLLDNGYVIGSTGKVWPGDLVGSGRGVNPAGRSTIGKQIDPPFDGISTLDYAGNFETFLDELGTDQPFCFWLGTHEPHRKYDRGSGIAASIDIDRLDLPTFLPDAPLPREDYADYLVEIQHFDRVVAQALDTLQQREMLDNTLVVVTSDNGMPFPRGKATLYDAGTRVPLAVRWPRGVVNSGRVVDHFVNLSDLAATFLDVAGVPMPTSVTARSLSRIMVDQPVANRDASFMAMERNEYCRPGGRGYPCRAIRTSRYLYIHNFAPDRWPAGSPDPGESARLIPFAETSLSITRSFLLNHRSHREFPDIASLADLAFGKRPGEELYDVLEDPDQLVNLAGRIETLEIQTRLRKRLFDHLRRTGDPRMVGGDVAWDDYEFRYPTRD